MFIFDSVSKIFGISKSISHPVIKTEILGYCFASDKFFCNSANKFFFF